MITILDYAGKWLNTPDWTPEREANARERLLPAVQMLEDMMAADGIVFPVNPATGNGVSGKYYGGFRPQACTIGAPQSNHKQGLAVDRFDPANAIDNWCMAHLDALEQCGIWIEHPDKTDGWSHWQCVPPHSGNRVFWP